MTNLLVVIALCVAAVIVAPAANAHFTMSSIPGAITARQGTPTGTTGGVVAPNYFKGAPICTPSAEFSVNKVAQEFPQFYSELGTWLGNISCYAASVSGTPGTPYFIDAPTYLNTTVYAGRLVSCSSTAGGATSCRAFYPRFDGSGQYCTVEPDDIGTLGYPAFNEGQVINGRVSVDTVWPDVGSLSSAVLNYYEPTNDAISSFYGIWNRLETTGTTGPSMLCFLHFARTCRGPACFTPPSSA